MVYVTCSVLSEENEDRVAAFLASEPGFRAGTTSAVFAAVTGRPAPAETVVPAPVGQGDAIRLTPATSGTDGFFVAVLERA
jgi:16S rRNA (cytosine967-C5)-methyltransferase